MVKIRKKDNEKAITPYESNTNLSTKRPYDLWNEMDQMFDAFRSGFDNLFWPWSETSILSPIRESQMPLLDVADHGDKYELNIEIPGYKKDDINIEVTPNSIELSAEYNEDTEDKGKNWLRRERSSVSFHRAIELPEEIKTDAVEAELDHGVLSVILPKMEPKQKIKAKKVKIK
jgi:HSP20 family protein